MKLLQIVMFGLVCWITLKQFLDKRSINEQVMGLENDLKLIIEAVKAGNTKADQAAVKIDELTAKVAANQGASDEIAASQDELQTLKDLVLETKVEVPESLDTTTETTDTESSDTEVTDNE